VFGFAAATAVALSGDVLGAPGRVPTREVVVTLKAPSLSAFGRSLQSAMHAVYLQRVEAAQNELARRVRATIPGAEIRWRYHLVANGFAVVLPAPDVAALRRIPGVAQVWPNVRYHALRATDGVTRIGADKLWGADLSTAGNGMKIGIIDDGLDASHPYFDPTGLQYPPGFPKGQTKYTTPKVIVQRTFAPAKPHWKYANVPFDPSESFHATHVAGIAAGDHGVNAHGTAVSGVAPNAYLGNYKALTIPTPGFGLDGNSAELAAAIEAAVADGMNVINLSLGEPEIAPSRDLVVHAIDAAAAAGVVPVVAAGNDFEPFAYGSVSSPGSAPDAITVAAATIGGQIASFSSAGPTPVSLRLKPDVTAPGVGILSSLPASQGLWGLLEGTSMASPHVAGAAALLLERHPAWTVEQVKSALVLTGDPVHLAGGPEAPALREGGGMIDLPRADNPLIFASPTSVSLGRIAPGTTGGATVELTDAGGGAGDWAVTTVVQSGTGTLSAPPTVTVPRALAVQAQAGAAAGDTSGFVVLTRGTDVRRIPFWFGVSAPTLASEKAIVLTHGGVYRSTTVGAPSRVSAYRYPTGGDRTYAGPERVFRVRIAGRPANFGVALLSGRTVPHVVIGADEDHVAGYAGLPLDINPYRKQYGASRLVAGAVLPTPGTYEIVFDTASAAAAGRFAFRYWLNDTTPPTLRLRSAKGGIAVTATDAGAGVDPASIVAKLDGRSAVARFANGVVRIAASKGRHVLSLTVSDYQETKNMEDVPPILPNTRAVTLTVRVR
jgi:subtilisin family serine protease